MPTHLVAQYSHILYLAPARLSMIGRSFSDIWLSQPRITRLWAAADIFTGVMVLFVMALMLAVVYNTVSMNLFERRRQLAALRTVGLSIRQIIAIVTLENLLAAALGLLIGLPLGWFFSLLMAKSYETDQYTIMLHIDWTTYLLAILAVVATTIIS